MHTHDHAHDSSTSNDLDFSSSASSDPDSFILWPWFFCFRWPWLKLLFFFTSSDFCLFYWRGFTQPIGCINLKPFFFFLQWWMMHNLLHLSVQQFLLADTWVNPMTLKSQTRSGDWRKLSKMPGMTWSKCSFCASVFWWTVCASSLLGQCFFAEPLDLWNLTWLHFEQLPLILRFCLSVWLGFFFCSNVAICVLNCLISILECGYVFNHFISTPESGYMLNCLICFLECGCLLNHLTSVIECGYTLSRLIPTLECGYVLNCLISTLECGYLLNDLTPTLECELCVKLPELCFWMKLCIGPLDHDTSMWLCV